MGLPRGYDKKLQTGRDIYARELGNPEDPCNRVIVIVPGTGSKEAMNAILDVRKKIPLRDLKIYGSDHKGVSGDHIKEARFGHIAGRKVVVIGRTHFNEGSPNVHLAMRLAFEQIAPHTDGVIFSSGAGSLYIPEEGIQESHALIAGSKQMPLYKGDIGIVTGYNRSELTSATPLISGEFKDGVFHGIHGWGNQNFLRAEQIVKEVQDGNCPIGRYYLVYGPGFEDPSEKREMAAKGCLYVGMSGVPEAKICTNFDLPFQWYILATNGPDGPCDPDEHSGAGEKAKEKFGKVIELGVERFPKREDLPPQTEKEAA